MRCIAHLEMDLSFTVRMLDYNDSFMNNNNDINFTKMLTTMAAPVRMFEEKTWHSIRTERDCRLNSSDWAALLDATPKPSQQAWLDYRQKLRDITQDFETPGEVVWPAKPNQFL